MEQTKRKGVVNASLLNLHEYKIHLNLYIHVYEDSSQNLERWVTAPPRTNIKVGRLQ